MIVHATSGEQPGKSLVNALNINKIKEEQQLGGEG